MPTKDLHDGVRKILWEAEWIFDPEGPVDEVKLSNATQSILALIQSRLPKKKPERKEPDPDKFDYINLPVSKRKVIPENKGWNAAIEAMEQVLSHE